MGDENKKITKIEGVQAFSLAHKASQIELVLVNIDGEAATDEPWRTLEFWTSNTMYGLDANQQCIEVSARVPGQKTPTHLLGAQLIGSQSRRGSDFSAAFPYPVPGMEAVFRLPGSNKHMTTSVVERVFLRVRITNLTLPGNEDPDWSTIAPLG